MLLGASCLLLYVLLPVPKSAVIGVVAGLYVIYSIFLLVRNKLDNTIHATVTLCIDQAFFFLCLLHPSQPGLWLSTICYVYLLSVATLLHDWPHVVFIVTTAVAFFLTFKPAPAYLLWPAISVAGVLAVLLAIQRKAMLERLSAALQRSVLSRSEAEIAREKERQRIAADFHDGPLQSFIGFQMRLEIIRKLLSRDAASAMRELIQLQDLGRSQVTELRAFVRNMQPADVTPENLAAGIRETVEHFERDSGISADLVCGDLSVLNEMLAGEILQIGREALNNVRKHSKASRVSISVEVVGEAIDMLVADDGSGFPFSGSYTLDELETLRLGPRSIKRRVRALRGGLTLDSRPTVGSTLKISVPNR